MKKMILYPLLMSLPVIMTDSLVSSVVMVVVILFYEWICYRGKDETTIYLTDNPKMMSPYSEIYTFEQVEKICHQISKIPKSIMIKLVLETNGKKFTNCERILRKLLDHNAGYRVYVKNRCSSPNAILVFGAKEIVMSHKSYLGKIDPQIKLNKWKKPIPIIEFFDVQLAPTSNNMYDIEIATKYFLEAKLAKQYSQYLSYLFNLIYKDDQTMKNRIKDFFIYSCLPHCKLFNYEECKEIGLPVRSSSLDEEEYYKL